MGVANERVDAGGGVLVARLITTESFYTGSGIGVAYYIADT